MAKPATVQIVSIPAPKLQVFLRLFLTGNFLAFLILLICPVVQRKSVEKGFYLNFISCKRVLRKICSVPNLIFHK